MQEFDSDVEGINVLQLSLFDRLKHAGMPNMGRYVAGKRYPAIYAEDFGAITWGVMMDLEEAGYRIVRAD